MNLIRPRFHNVALEFYGHTRNTTKYQVARDNAGRVFYLKQHELAVFDEKGLFQSYRLAVDEQGNPLQYAKP